MTASALAATPALPPPLAGLSAIIERYDLILSDVWGVIHNGMKAHPAACDALRSARTRDVPVVLISNAPRQSPVVVGQLDRLGVPRAAYDAIVTSGDVSRDVMRTRPGEPVCHIGPARDHVVFEGLDAPRVPLAEAAYVLCTGLVDDRTETPADYEDLLQAVKARNLFFLCGNPDKVVEVGTTLIYCAGALGDRYREIGGEVLFAGKPYEPAYAAAIGAGERILGRAVDRSRVLAIGDAMRTDVAGAVRNGIDVLFLAEGIHAAEVLRDGALDLPGLARLTGETGLFPTHIMPRLWW